MKRTFKVLCLTLVLVMCLCTVSALAASKEEVITYYNMETAPEIPDGTKTTIAENVTVDADKNIIITFKQNSLFRIGSANFYFLGYTLTATNNNSNSNVKLTLKQGDDTLLTATVDKNLFGTSSSGNGIWYYGDTTLKFIIAPNDISLNINEAVDVWKREAIPARSNSGEIAVLFNDDNATYRAVKTLKVETIPEANLHYYDVKDKVPTISDDGTKLVFPEIVSDKYEVVLYGSSNESVIALDGTIYTPLEDMTVNLMYKIVNKTDADDFVIDNYKSIDITVPGKYSKSDSDNKRPEIVPGIREWKGHTGNFTLTDSSKIVIADSSLKDNADTIAYYFKEMLGKTVSVTTGTPSAGDIYLTLGDKAYLGEEGYTVEIADKVTVEAYNVKGALYAGASLTQIMDLSETNDTLPKGLIRDYPEYEVRSIMFDVARYYFPKEYVTELGRYAAYFKLNEFRMHINDNGGEQSTAFIIESKLFPKINSTTSAKKLWTQEEYKAFQKELKKYGIKVITEFDTPGHSGFVRLHDSSLALSWNVNEMDLKNPAATQFMKDLLDEFLDGDDPVIQSDTIHVGGDEYLVFNEDRQAEYMDDVAVYFKEISDHVLNKGYKARMWNAMGTGFAPAIGEVSNEVVLNYWNGYEANYWETIAAGYPIINNNTVAMYIASGVSGYAAKRTTEDIYDTWEVPVLGRADVPNASPLLKGAETNYWGDVKSGLSYVDVFAKFMKRQMMLVAEKTWYGEKTEGQTGALFVERMNKVADRAPGTNLLRTVDSKDNLVADYDFETVEDSLVKDNGTNGYDATLNGLEVADSNGSKVAKLDGVGYISLPFDEIGYPYTINFDLYLEAAPENAVLFTGDEGTFYLNYNNTGKMAYSRRLETYIFDYTPDLGVWTNITLSCDDTNTHLEIEGIYDVEPKYNFEVYDEWSTTFVLPTEKIGSGVTGAIDNIKLYNQVMTYADIYGEDVDYSENIALEKDVTVSGLAVEGANTGAMAVDGSTSTYAALNNADDASLIIDLADDYVVSSVEVNWNTMPASYQIYVSEDGDTWNLIYENTSVTDATETITLTSAVKAKHIKYQQVKMNNGVSGTISELEVYGLNADAILADAKTAIDNTTETDDNKAFIDRMNANVTVLEDLIENGAADDIYTAANAVKNQTTSLSYGVTDATEADTSVLVTLLTENLDADNYKETGFVSYTMALKLARKALYDLTSDQASIDAAAERIQNSKFELEKITIEAVESNRTLYGTNTWENAFDGSSSTYYWTSGNQKEGDYIKFTFKKPTSLQSVTVACSGLDKIYSGIFQVSDDGEIWTDAGTFGSSATQTLTLDVASTKYARIYIDAAQSRWLKISEISFAGSLFVDTLPLEKELAEVIDEDKYTTDSYAVYAAAKAEAEAVLESTSLTSEAITNAVTALQNAKASLVERGDIAPLNTLIAEIDAMDLSVYTDFSKSELETALSDAKTLVTNSANATQDDVTNAIKAINDAKALLCLKVEGVDDSKLEEIIVEVEALDTNSYTEESVNALMTAVKEGKTLLYDSERTQDDVDAAVNAITSAKSALASMTNVALKKTVTVSGLEVDGKYTGDLAVDGKTGYPSRVSLERTDDSWLKIDLENVYLVEQMKIRWATNSIPKQFQILVSEDDVNWSVAYENLSYDLSSAGADPWDTLNFEKAHTARYVKYQTIKKGNYTSAWEIRVFGGATGTIDTTNLASVIADAEKVSVNAYTEETVEAFETSLAYAKSIVKAVNATQTLLDSAESDLKAKKAALTLKDTKGYASWTTSDGKTVKKSDFVMERTFKSTDTIDNLKGEGYAFTGSWSGVNGNGIYYKSSSSKNGSVKYTGASFGGGYTIETSTYANYISNGNYIQFNTTADGDYYKLSIDKSTVKLTKYQDGITTSLLTDADGNTVDSVTISAYNNAYTNSRIKLVPQNDGSLQIIVYREGTERLNVIDKSPITDPGTVTVGLGWNTNMYISKLNVYPNDTENVASGTFGVDGNDVSFTFPVAMIGYKPAVVAALYSGNKMVDVKMLDIADVNADYVPLFDTTNIVDADVKVFVWNNIGDIIPLSAPYILN